MTDHICQEILYYCYGGIIFGKYYETVKKSPKIAKLKKNRSTSFQIRSYQLKGLQLAPPYSTITHSHQ